MKKFENSYKNTYNKKDRLVYFNSNAWGVRDMGRRQVPQEMQKKSKSVHLEQWIWDLAAQMQPCRSAAIRDLFLAKMKEDLIKAGLAEENMEITVNMPAYI
ncbi:hypothetical protein V7200_16545 [Cytobacillus firmus]|uniref:Uncharacterized protein n=1 Tax=Cytobacillus firmus TaxID=1399 RepID=A0A800MSE9_CYTFI|nr:hypothetical protein [Cytobacillus firmus]KAF0821629.1 hypothetical protein KIS1582_4637 [Cytobacillus firmus]